MYAPIHIPSEVIFQNPSLMDLDIETLRTCMLINKDWYTCMNHIKKHIIEASFSNFIELTKIPISDENTSFQLSNLHSFLTRIQHHIQCPNGKNIKVLMNQNLFQKHIKEKTAETTLRMLLNIQDHISNHTNGEFNEYEDNIRTIIRIIVIQYTFQFIDHIYQQRVSTFINSSRLKHVILERGNALCYQIKEFSIKHPHYKTICDNIQRHIRYTCRSICKV